MTPEQIEGMKRDREAGSPGPWIWETESGEWPDHSLVAGDGEAVLYWDFDCGFRFNSRKDANRLTRVPDMEAHILALTAENVRLRATAKAAEARADDAISTLNAWFDRRKLAHEAIDTAVLDAARGYLRTSRSGGMDQETSDMIEGVIADMARLSVFADLFARAALAAYREASHES